MAKLLIEVDEDLARYIRAMADNNGLSYRKVANDLIEKGVRVDELLAWEDAPPSAEEHINYLFAAVHPELFAPGGEGYEPDIAEEGHASYPNGTPPDKG